LKVSCAAIFPCCLQLLRLWSRRPQLLWAGRAVVRSCSCRLLVILLAGPWISFHSLVWCSVRAFVAVIVAFLAPLPPLPLPLIPVHLCAAPLNVYCYSLFRLYVSGCLSFSFLVGSFAGSMLGKRSLSFTNDRVVATSRVGGCVAKGSVPSVCARVEGLGGVDGALAPLRPLGDMRGNQAGWRVSRVMQARASGLRENPLEC